MAAQSNKLTDTRIRAAKPAEKAWKMADGGGLHLLVTPAGGKLWRLKYRIGGKEKQLALGSYPEVGLKEARDRREAAKRATSQGQDPSRQKRLSKHRDATNESSTFELLARDWHERQKARWVGRHASDVIDSLERLVFPAIGSMHINAVTLPRALGVIRHIEMNNGGETARLSRDGEQSVRMLTDHSGVSQPAVSKHLGVLKLAGLVRDRHEGRQTNYSAQPQGLAPLIDWMSLYGAFWRDRFDRLEALFNWINQ